MSNIIKYSKNGTEVSVFKYDPNLVKDQIEPKIYICNKNPMTGQFYLNTFADNFEIKDRIYGTAYQRMDKIISTFKDRGSTTTGILATGQKGSGKSLLMKLVSNKLLLEGLPTVIINQPYSGDTFNEFIADIGPAVLNFDEFEKVYDENQDQQFILSLLDGTMATRKLIFLTANSEWKIRDEFMNRPGRVFYHFKYKGLDLETIKDYCEKNLKQISELKNIIEFTSLFENFNFDMLKSLVEEMNRYDLPVKDAVEDLNMEPFKSERNKSFKLTVLVNNIEQELYDDEDNIIYQNPYRERLRIEWYETQLDDNGQPKKDEDGEIEKEYKMCMISMDDLVKSKNNSDKLVFKPKIKGNKDVVIILEPMQSQSFIHRFLV